MTSVTETPFTDSDLSGPLLAVGAEPPAGPGTFDDSTRSRNATRVVDRLTTHPTPPEGCRHVLRTVNER